MLMPKARKSFKLKTIRHVLCTVGCALLLASGFLWSWAWLVSLVGVVLSIYLLSKSDQLSRKAFLWLSLLYGYVFFGTTLAWVYGIHTTELIADTFFSVVFLGLTYAIMVGSLAVGFLFFGIFYRVLRVSTKNWTILCIPVIFTVSEYFRSVFFSVFSLGDGGIVGPYWNFGSLGFLTVNTPLKYATRIVGLYGSSLLVVLIAVIIFQLLRKKYNYGLLFLIPLLVTISGWYFYRTSNGTSLSVATTSLSDTTEDGYQDDLTKKVAGAGELQLLVLPEYSYYFVDSDGETTNYKIPKNVALTIDSGTDRQSGLIKNMVSYHDNNSNLLQSYQKHFLIPGGEFIPYIYHIILFYSGNTSLVSQFHQKHALISASQKERPYIFNGVSYGSLACSGAIAPSLYTSLANDGAEVFTNSASISTLGVSPLYYRQASQMSAFTAIANARPFVQSARGGSSYMLTKDGHTTATEKAATDSAIVGGRVITNKTRTVYTLLGEWLVWLSAAIMIILMAKRMLKKDT